MSYPVIRYSPTAYAVLGAAWLGAGGVLVGGLVSGVVALTVAGAASIVFMALFTRSTLAKLRSGRPVLTREGDRLVGDALRTPLPVAGTTYEIATDYEGGWVVVLRHGGATLRLAPGGWRIDGERRATREAVARALEQLGLSAH
jgi:hypothetical protein